MVEHYKQTPWWWFAFTLLLSFVLGLVVVIKDKTTLPIWAYVVSLIVGSVIAPFVSRRSSGRRRRFGD